MLIYVDAPSGRTTRVSLRPSDIVADLKVRIEEEEWIPQDRQCLTYCNDKLEDEHTFESYGIGEGATILLSQIGAAFPINIRFPTGETTRILIERINTIGSLKSRFHVWVPRDTQQLIFEGQQLEDKKLVFDYNIQRESTIDLQLPPHLDAPFPDWIAGFINITFVDTTGTIFRSGIRVRAKGTDTIDDVKSRFQNVGGIPFDTNQQLVYDGRLLENGRTISEYVEIQKDVTFYIVEEPVTCRTDRFSDYLGVSYSLRYRARPCSEIYGRQIYGRQSFGLVNVAQAIALRDWDGVMPWPAIKYGGLQLSKGDNVIIGRIVNDEWYQGFNNKNSGYFPRAFVSVRKIESSEFKDVIHVDDTPIEELQLNIANGESSVKAPPKPILAFLQRLPKIISCLFSSTPPPPDPDLPPSPIPAPPAFDKTVDGSRVLVLLSLDPIDKQRNYTLRATLSLNSAPGARFSGLTFKFILADGTILAISPENLVGPETEAEVSKEENLQSSLNASLQAGSAPLSASIGASTTFTRAEHITFIRKTRGTVQGNGVGSSKAYWVMKEDNGPAAEQGLGPVFDLMLKLNVRPAIISFKVVAHILLAERGKKKTIRSGILVTSV